jgi:hypothetical protein
VKVSAANEPDRFVEFTEPLAELVQDGYVDPVRYLTIGCPYGIEHRTEFSRYVDIEGQFGTTDTWIANLEENELIVADAKFGYRPVAVEDNSQLMIYALGVLDELSLVYEFEKVRLMIFQPRVNEGPTEWVISIKDLLKWAEEKLKPAAQRVIKAEMLFKRIDSEQEANSWGIEYLNRNPNEDECAFCRALAICPSAQQKVQDTVGAAFEMFADEGDVKNWIPGPGPNLDIKMRAAEFLEDWIKAVRASMESHLLAGGTSTIYGLGMGREGNRKWKSIDEAEAMLRGKFKLKIDDCYTKKLISPTAAEKLAPKPEPKRKRKDATPAPEPLITAKQWAQLQELIERNPAKPSVQRLDQITKPYALPSEADFNTEPADGDGSDLV